MQLLLPLLTVILVVVGTFCLMVAIDNDRRIRKTMAKGNGQAVLHGAAQPAVAFASPRASDK